MNWDQGYINPFTDDGFLKLNTITEQKVGGVITDQDRLIAAKQILLGISLLFAITVGAYLIKPNEGQVLLEICKTTLPPLATLIIAFYFKG